MKISLYIIGLLLTASCNKNVNGLDYYQVNGRVDSIQEISYIARKDMDVWIRDPSDKIDLPHLIIFNHNGNPVNEQDYSLTDKKYELSMTYEYIGGIVSKTITYDSYNRITCVQNILQIQPDFQIEKIAALTRQTAASVEECDTIFVEWKNNRPTVFNNKKSYKLLKEYNEAGNLIKETLFKNNKLKEVTLFQYLDFDPKGNWTKQLLYRPEGYTGFITERKISYY